MILWNLTCKPTAVNIPVKSNSRLSSADKNIQSQNTQREGQDTARGRNNVKENKGQGGHATYWYSIHTPLYFSLPTPTTTGDTPLHTETRTKSISRMSTRLMAETVSLDSNVRTEQTLLNLHFWEMILIYVNRQVYIVSICKRRNTDLKVVLLSIYLQPWLSQEFQTWYQCPGKCLIQFFNPQGAKYEKY